MVVFGQWGGSPVTRLKGREKRLSTYFNPQVRPNEDSEVPAQLVPFSLIL